MIYTNLLGSYASMKTAIISAAQDGAIAQAVEHLMQGHPVAVPTETVYGLAADACNDEAVAAIYAAKGRPSFNPLISHVSSPEMAAAFVEIPAAAKGLMQAFWPGPLTLVLPKRADCSVSPAVSAGLDTLAVRCPANAVTRAIIDRLGKPIAAPSANPSGKLSPTTAEAVRAGLDGKIPLIIDDGQTGVGIESTIVGIAGNKITLLRPGSITADEIADAAGAPVLDRDSSTITAPGQLASHYAPKAPLRLGATAADGAFLLGFGAIDGNLNLSAKGDLAEAAHNLFDYLRRADEHASGGIAVAPIPNEGIGIAINDRLKRAAAPRDAAEAAHA